MKPRFSLIATFLIITSSVFSQIPMGNVVAYYPLDVNADDATDNGNDGIIFGAFSGASN